MLIFPVYETDRWHTLQDRECKGIYTSKEEAIESIIENHCIDLHELGALTEDEAKEKLRKIFEIGWQTHNYSINYEIEVWNANEWS